MRKRRNGFQQVNDLDPLEKEGIDGKEGCNAKEEGELTFTININMDNKCKGCDKGGATDNGYCLECIAKMIKKSNLNKKLKERVREMR